MARKALVSIILVFVFAFAVYADSDVDFWLDMEDVDLEYGDSLMLEFVTMNYGNTISEAAFCLLLEINGSYWCWPSWCPLNDHFDYGIKSIPDGRTKYWIFNSMWPDVPSIGIDLYFYGAVMDANLTELLAPVYQVTWTYN